ncbi:M15 family metallopeptidase [Flexivirga caeni]|nr:M15 family metallopeptidase [Flexivirga caeni]
MDIADRIERSKSTERIDYTKIGFDGRGDPLVKVESSDKIMVSPVWMLEDDFEGSMYADYIAEHPAYDDIYVRSQLLQRIERAAESLDDKYKLVVRAGHRPLAIQRRLLRECAQDYKDDHPDATDQEALKHARTFVSDPDISQPPHCCGAAIDVELFDIDSNKLVDFGSAMNVDDEISYLHYDQISPEQKANRMLLLSTMLEQKLASVAFEWWHFSYGDQTWAWFYGEPCSFYSPVDI